MKTTASGRSAVAMRTWRRPKVSGGSTSNAIWVDAPDGAPAELKRWKLGWPAHVAQGAGALLDRVEGGAIAGDRPGPVGEQRVIAGAVVFGRHSERGGIRRGLGEVFVGEFASPRRHCDEGRHAGTPPLGLVRVAHAGAGALGRR